VNGDIAVELDRELTARFDAEMEQIYFRAKHEVKYNATYFLRTVKEVWWPRDGSPPIGERRRGLRFRGATPSRADPT